MNRLNGRAKSHADTPQCFLLEHERCDSTAYFDASVRQQIIPNPFHLDCWQLQLVDEQSQIFQTAKLAVQYAAGPRLTYSSGQGLLELFKKFLRLFQLSQNLLVTFQRCKTCP